MKLNKTISLKLSTEFFEQKLKPRAEEMQMSISTFIRYLVLADYNNNKARLFGTKELDSNSPNFNNRLLSELTRIINKAKKQNGKTK